MKREQKRPEDTIITVNGVTYRSPEEMPEEARAVWDVYARRLEQQGSHWRDKQRIEVTWGKEGSSVKQSIRVEGRPGRYVTHRSFSEPRTWLDVPITIFVIALLGLFFFGILWLGPPLIISGSSVRLLIAFVAIYVIFVLVVRRGYKKQRSGPMSRMREHMEQMGVAGDSLPDLPASPWQSTGGALTVLAGGLIVTYIVTFAGLPKALHYIERQRGEVTVTISGKYPYGSKSARCAPRLSFEEFSSFGDQLCVDRSLFNVTEPGDRIRMQGSISRYAIEPDKLELLESARLKDVE